MEQKSALEVALTNLFYDYMSSTDIKEFDGHEVSDSSLTPVDLLYQETVDTLEENAIRIKIFEDAMKEHKNDEGVVEQLKRQVQPLLEEKKHFENSSMEYMKKLYEETKDVSYSRNEVRIPLRSGQFNHVDLLGREEKASCNIEVQYLFYDDLGVIKGKYDQYKTLKPSQRRKFIEDNTEITHICLIVNGVSYIGVKGELREPEEWSNIEVFKATQLK